MRIKKGFPPEGELVLCKVTNIQYHSVFCNLEEYGKSGMIHISEVSPGRIRNIRDYVKEGKVVVCKVLKIHEEKGHIDLSLRRVSEGQRREKANELKQEQKAEKIVEGVAKNNKQKPEELIENLYKAVEKDSEKLYPVFEAVVEEGLELKEYKLDPKIVKALETAIKEKIKPKEVMIKGNLRLVSWAPNGNKIVKEALEGAEKTGTEIKYKGAGTYGLEVKAKEFKSAEKTLKKAIDYAIETVEKKGGKGIFERIEP